MSRDPFGDLFDGIRGERYVRRDAPRGSSMQATTCARCGHEELERPVWLGVEGSSTVAPYGTGCAAVLLGVKQPALEAELAAEELEAMPKGREMRSWFGVTKPGRWTPKIAAETAKRHRVDTATAERAYRLWKTAQRAPKA